MKKLLLSFMAVIVLLTVVAFSWDRTLPDSVSMVTNVYGHAYLLQKKEDDQPESRFSELVIQTDNEGKSWIPISRGMMIQSGSIIRTGAIQQKGAQDEEEEVESSVDILADNGLAFRLKDQTLVELQKKEMLEEDEGDSFEDEAVDVALVFGKLLGKVDPALKETGFGLEAIRIRTPTAVVGVRGTTYAVGFPPGGLFSKVTVLEGTVHAFSRENPDEEIVIDKGRKSIVRLHSYLLRNLNKRDVAELREVDSLQIAVTPIDVLVDLFNIRPDLSLIAEIKRFIDKMDDETKKRLDQLKVILEGGKVDE
ncbi:MAG: FecR domain-containing protein [Magnetococcales bacterium]|nr:FecR domain-containing protein [Magnetococcales bacterium]